jgi:hypothetical protein
LIAAVECLPGMVHFSEEEEQLDQEDLSMVQYVSLIVSTAFFSTHFCSH